MVYMDHGEYSKMHLGTRRGNSYMYRLHYMFRKTYMLHVSNFQLCGSKDMAEMKVQASDKNSYGCVQ